MAADVAVIAAAAAAAAATYCVLQHAESAR